MAKAKKCLNSVNSAGNQNPSPSIWVTGANLISVIDPVSNTVTQTIPNTNWGGEEAPRNHCFPWY